MTAPSIDDLLEEFGTKPFTAEDFQREKTELENLFRITWGIQGEEQINQEIANGTLDCSAKHVEDWIELMALKPYVLPV